jgi:hypothetical protein
MAYSTLLDLTSQYNTDGYVVIDVGGFLSGVVYIYNGSKASVFSSSNDGGEELGTIMGSALTAENFYSTRLTNLATGLPSYTAVAGNSNYKFEKIGKYLKVEASGILVDKLIIQLFKIN